MSEDASDDATPDRLGRRRFLVATGGVSLAGLGGCLGDDGSGDGNQDDAGPDGDPADGNGSSPNGNGDPPDHQSPEETLETLPETAPVYRPYLSDPDQVVMHVDFARERNVPAFDLSTVEEQPPFPESDTIAESFAANNGALPLAVLGTVQIVVPVVQQFLNVGAETDEEPLMWVETATLVQSGEVVGLSGDLDEAAFTAHETIEQVGSQHGFRLYESDPENIQTTPLAVREDTVLVPFGNQETSRERLDGVLETLAAETPFDADVDWLVEYCGPGAFVDATGVSLQPTGDGPGDPGDPPFAIDPADYDQYVDILGSALRGRLFVLDEHEAGHVTRSGFVFESAADLPTAAEITSAIAPGATRTNVGATDNRLVVEAFWE